MKTIMIIDEIKTEEGALSYRDQLRSPRAPARGLLPFLLEA